MPKVFIWIKGGFVGIHDAYCMLFEKGRNPIEYVISYFIVGFSIFILFFGIVSLLKGIS